MEENLAQPQPESIVHEPVADPNAVSVNDQAEQAEVDPSDVAADGTDVVDGLTEDDILESDEDAGAADEES